MLERRSCLVSRVYSSSCPPETQWSYMSYRVDAGKRPLEIDDEEDLQHRRRKYNKLFESFADPEELNTFHDESSNCTLEGNSSEQSSDQRPEEDYQEQLSDHRPGEDYQEQLSDQRPAEDYQEQLSDQCLAEDYQEQFGDQCPAEDHQEELGSRRLAEDYQKQSSDQCPEENCPEHLSDQCRTEDYPEHLSDPCPAEDFHEQLSGQHPAEDYQEQSSDQRTEEASQEQSSDQRQMGDSADSGTLIHTIGRDNSISCLIRCSRSDYGSIAQLNRSFRSLVRSGEIYRLRRQNGMVEHWIYFSCHLLEWEAFDPIRRRWMHLPRMPSNECFMCSDKESLAVGTEILVFGKEVMSHVIHRYSLLTNSWSPGTRMNAPRCLFGSASLGEIAILAGGCDSQGTILSSAELYNSETQTWTLLPSMKKPRKMCSAVFMDGKFYVIGGIGGSDLRVLTCGEEYDMETKTWAEIPNMSPPRSTREDEMPAAVEAPPLVAVVNNELYAADYADMEVRKYDKERRVWFTIGRLPERAISMNGWGLAFRACGDKLIVIGGPKSMGEGFIEINSWAPGDGPPHWNLLARKQSANFVYNCAVMGC